MTQGIDVVWWEVLNGAGREVGLEEVRARVEGRASNTAGAVFDGTPCVGDQGDVK